MHVVQRRQRTQRRMYLPSERMAVNGIGLGEVDGLFNMGKMFKRMFTFTPSSFKMKNIAGAIGSGLMTVGTMGIANVASEFAGPSGLRLTKGTITGAHSKAMEYTGYAGMAAAAAAGLYFGGGALISAVGPGAGAGSAAIGTAASGSATIGAATGQVAVTGGGFLSTVGTGLSTVGSWIGTGLKVLTSVLPAIGGIGGGGAQQQQQGGMTQAEYDAQVAQQQQAAYAAQVEAQQRQMYMPGMVQDTSYMGPPTIGQPGTMQTSYGDLRTPYTAITEDGQQIQVDPATGEVIPAGMSTPMIIGIGGVTLLVGWYLMSGSKSTN